MTPLGPRDPVTCPKFAGHPTLPAECCALRTLAKGTGQARKKPAYPVCESCPLGRLRRQKLEAGGWTFNLQVWRKKQYARLRSQVRARKRLVSTRSAAPWTSPK